MVEDHFTHVSEMVIIGSGAQRKFDTVFLSRYACYLLIQNSDPAKPNVALGQTYFAVQTRRQELADEQTKIPEDQHRLLLRSQMSVNNRQLAGAARDAGVIRPVDFAIFQDHGYAGLYGGLKSRDIHARKGLKKSQAILDHMGSDELAANSFRASLTKQKIERERIQGKENANRAHNEMGQAVRETIIKTGATLPEELPTPEKSIKQLEREEQFRLKHQGQLKLFETSSEKDL
jgi:DNA-damage-inducible protein D